MKIKKIILLGYMGSGKSAVGSQLNKEINVTHCDLDHYIEKQLQPQPFYIESFLRVKIRLHGYKRLHPI